MSSQTNLRYPHMTTNDTSFGICPLRENYTAIAARARREQSQVVGASIISVFHAFGRVAAKFVRPAKNLMFFTRTHRSVAAPEPGAEAEQVEVATWIRPQAPIVLPASVQQTIACDAGTVWITQGDSQDYVLTAGQRLTLHPTDKVIITAMFVPALVRRIAGMR
jgi:hypothetical protein